MVAHGEVWWAEHPDEGRRPVCVLTRTAAIPVVYRVIVAPITRTIRGIPTEVFLDQDDGMPEDCVINLDNTSTVPKAALTGRITALSPRHLADVCRALAAAVDCHWM